MSCIDHYCSLLTCQLQHILTSHWRNRRQDNCVRGGRRSESLHILVKPDGYLSFLPNVPDPLYLTLIQFHITQLSESVRLLAFDSFKRRVPSS